jgi:hypothetical protein
MGWCFSLRVDPIEKLILLGPGLGWTIQFHSQSQNSRERFDF